MRRLFLLLISLHGALHFLGFAKAFGLAELPQLTVPISRAGGMLWLAAGLLMLLSGMTLVLAPRVWWIVALAAVILSQVVIVSSWSDAKFGTIANLLILLGAVYGFASQGPSSVRAQYRRAVAARLETAPTSMPTLTEADLADLPEPVQRYLRVTGQIGRPRVHHFGVRWRGRIRSGPDDPWMEFIAEQVNFPDEPARFFAMHATRTGLPVDVLHVFQDGSATMRVRLLSLFPLVDARGPELTRAETVTLLNDLCLLAPAALVDAPVRWEPVDEHAVRAHYTLGSTTVSAVLDFNEDGELVDFVSDDRLAASADGKELTPLRWSTPVSEYRSFGGRRVSTRGAGLWHPPEGLYAYIELELTSLETNHQVGNPRSRPSVPSAPS